MDRLGIILSGLCALHCVAGIVLVAVLGAGLGVGGAVLLDPAIHRTGLVVATIIAALAIGVGTIRHRRVLPLLVALCGLALMAGALMVEHGVQEMVMTVMGVALVACGHLFNLRPPR